MHQASARALERAISDPCGGGTQAAPETAISLGVCWRSLAVLPLAARRLPRQRAAGQRVTRHDVDGCRLSRPPRPAGDRVESPSESRKGRRRYDGRVDSSSWRVNRVEVGWRSFIALLILLFRSIIPAFVMVAACVLRAALDEPLMPWWSEWPRTLPMPASIDPLDGFLSPNNTTDVTAQPADTQDAHDVHTVETPLDPFTPPAHQPSPQAPANTDQPYDEPSAAPASSGEVYAEPRAPARPANFLPPFVENELSTVRRPRRAVDLTGPRPSQPPPSSSATPSPDRRKRRYASGEFFEYVLELTAEGGPRMVPYPPINFGGQRITRARTLPILPTFTPPRRTSLGISGLQGVQPAGGPANSPFQPSLTDSLRSPLAPRAAPSASRHSSLPGPSVSFQELHSFHTPVPPQSPLPQPPEGLWDGWNPYVWNSGPSVVPLRQSFSAPCTSSSSPVPDADRRASAPLPTGDTQFMSQADAFLAALTGAAGQ